MAQYGAGARAAGSAAAGFIVDRWGFQVMFRASGVLACVGAVCCPVAVNSLRTGRHQMLTWPVGAAGQCTSAALESARLSEGAVATALTAACTQVAGTSDADNVGCSEVSGIPVDADESEGARLIPTDPEQHPH